GGQRPARLHPLQAGQGPGRDGQRRRGGVSVPGGARAREGRGLAPGGLAPARPALPPERRPRQHVPGLRAVPRAGAAERPAPQVDPAGARVVSGALRDLARQAAVYADAARKTGLLGALRPSAVARYAVRSVGKRSNPSGVITLHALNTPEREALVSG